MRMKTLEKKTVYDLSIFREYSSSIDGLREIKFLPFGEFEKYLGGIYTGCQKEEWRIRGILNTRHDSKY